MSEFGDERLPARFWSKVQVADSGCWLWTGGRYSNGYGGYHVNRGEKRAAHRVAYTAMVGPIPPGFQIDHVKARGCSSRLCVNPGHLEPVTRLENVRRAIPDMLSSAYLQRRREIAHCPHGHEYTPDNTRTDKRGRRTCIKCNREYVRRSKAKRRAARG